MTNREWLNNLSNDELAKSPYFCDCILGYINREIYKKEGHPCPKDAEAKTADIPKFILSGRSKEICRACKREWLEAEHEAQEEKK